MKKLLVILISIIPTIIIGQTLNPEVYERTNYFKTQPIFVVQFSLDKRTIKKLSITEKENAFMEIDRINKNLRVAFKKFWNINDTIVFVLDSDLKTVKKENKGAIFFELIQIGETTNDKGKVLPVTAYHLIRSKKPNYLRNVAFIPGPDSSLVNTITNVRQLKMQVTTGEMMNKKYLGPKTILININDGINSFGESYVELIRSKYTGSYIEVNSKFVLDAILRKDPKYIYVKNGSTYNAEDGSMIPLY